MGNTVSTTFISNPFQNKALLKMLPAEDTFIYTCNLDQKQDINFLVKFNEIGNHSSGVLQVKFILKFTCFYILEIKYDPYRTLIL